MSESKQTKEYKFPSEHSLEVPSPTIRRASASPVIFSSKEAPTHERLFYYSQSSRPTVKTAPQPSEPVLDLSHRFSTLSLVDAHARILGRNFRHYRGRCLQRLPTVISIDSMDGHKDRQQEQTEALRTVSTKTPTPVHEQIRQREDHAAKGAWINFDP